MKSTTRWQLRYPEGTDAADVPLFMQRLATDLDGVAMDDQGLLQDRPTSSPTIPGKKGRYWFATDNGVLYRDHGTGWTHVITNGDARLSDQRTPTDASVTDAKVAAGAGIAKSKLGALAIVDADVSSTAAIAEAKLALASDAAPGTPSRRTLGTGAQQAAAGDDSRIVNALQSGARIVGASTSDYHLLEHVKNKPSVFIGTTESTSAYAETDLSGAVRMGGASVAWGDFAYYPRATDGHFKLWRSPGAIGTTYASLAVDRLFLGPNAANVAVGGVENLRTIRGTVNGDGTIAAGSGFTVTRAANGTYDITFSTAFSSRQSVTVTPESFSFTAGTNFTSTSQTRVVTHDSTATIADCAFSFIAVGPR